MEKSPLCRKKLKGQANIMCNFPQLVRKSYLRNLWKVKPRALNLQSEVLENIRNTDFFTYRLKDSRKGTKLIFHIFALVEFNSL